MNDVDLSGKTIWVADDNRLVADMMQQLLESRHRATVQIFTDSGTLIDKLGEVARGRTTAPDILITDWSFSPAVKLPHTPAGAGIQRDVWEEDDREIPNAGLMVLTAVTKAQNARGSYIPVIISTGQAVPRHLLEQFSDVDVEVMLKPPRFDRLSDLITAKLTETRGVVR